MTTHAFYPYPVTTSLGLTIDSEEPALGMDTNSRYLRLWEAPEAAWLLQVETHLPADVLDAVVAPDELEDPPVAMALTLRSDTSRRRLVIDLPFTLGTSRRPLEFRRDDWSGLVTAELSLVRTKTRQASGAMWATDRHTVIGMADPVRIDVDEPIRPPGDSLRIEWADFTESNWPWMKSHDGDLFALHTPGTGEAPTLYLNQAISSAVSVLMSTGTHGRKPRTRDATFQMITHQVWSSVLGAAMGELADASHTHDQLDDAMEDLDPWMPQVLRDWAPWIQPQGDSTEALQELWESVRTGQWERLLIQRLPNAIQSRFETVRGFAGLIREFNP